MDAVRILFRIELAHVVLILLLNGYMGLFALIAAFGRKKRSAPCRMKNRYAILICARNESRVIARNLQSIVAQTYPAALLQTFVMADNCTDDTAMIARQHGATVYERSDTERIGKGYALEALLSHIGRDHPDGFDGYLILDADTVLSPDYVERVNEAFCEGNRIVCGCHNSVNMDAGFFAMGQGMMFLVQCRMLNYPRRILGLGAFVCGTGVLIGAEVLRECGGWPYHMLTEDIEFTMDQLLRGRRVCYCHDAVLYEDRPENYRAGRHQLTRWVQGFLQAASFYWPSLLRRALRERDFSCYDLLMCYLPMAGCVTGALGFGLIGGMAAWLVTGRFALAFLPVALFAAGVLVMLLLTGLMTVLLEWRRIRISAGRKLLAAAVYPLYMFLFLGISQGAPYRRRQWKVASRPGGPAP